MPFEPDTASPPTPATGRRFGPYLLQDLLGAGGMGEVYRARDTRLDRDVAVKMLSGELALDPERLARLVREARVLASLNHPHVAAIYEFEQVDGVSALVLEIVEGQTLAERLRQGPIPYGRARSISDQIVSAVDAAHRAGIIHRDLKPGNIKIRPDGTVKVLDFGLAKTVRPSPTADGMTTQAVPFGATRLGVVLGTPAYMSPEQARGEPVDERTDIWAFGVVFYEMLTGRRPFTGRTTNETLAAVLEEEPDWSHVPRHAQRLLRACLQRDPARRLRAIADAPLLLDDPASTTPATWPGRSLGPALAAIALLLAVPLLLIHLPRTVPDPPPVRFQVPAPPGLTPTAPVVSPDGKSIAFVAAAQGVAAVPGFWLHSLETGRSRLLIQPVKGMFPLPFWSPDSRRVAVVGDGALTTIDLTTGAQHRVTDIQALGGGSGVWNSDGVILFSAPGGLMRISAQGGTPELVTQVDPERGEVGHFLPAFLPGGRRVLYLRASPTTDASGIYAGSLDARPGEQSDERLVATRSGPIYLPATGQGHPFLLFFRGSTLLAQGFDEARLALRGDAVLVADRVQIHGVPGPRYGHASVSATGVLAYRQRDVLHATLVWVDRSGRELGAFVPDPLANPSNLRFSPDGRRLALTVDGDLWIYHLDGRPPVKLTTDGVADVLLWSPDGSRIIYETTDVPMQLLSISADDPGDTPRIVSPPGHYHPQGWSAAGDRMIVSVSTPNSTTGWDIVTIPAEGQGESAAIVQTRFIDGLAGVSLSPNQQWLAYTSNATGSTEVWVRRYPGPGRAERISPEGGADPLWSRDGRELFYVAHGRMMAVRISTAGDRLDFSAPIVLFASPYVHRPLVALAYDVTSDGRFLMMKRATPASESPGIEVVLNWKPTQR